MPWIRQRPSGKWSATVYTPAGRRDKTHELKGVVARWAHDLEAEIARGEYIDPRNAKLTVAYIWDEHSAARRLEKSSKNRDESVWKNWVRPRWGSVPAARILKPDVQRWVNELEEDKVGAWVIVAAVNVLKAVLELGIDAGLIRSNPARRVKTPVPPKHEPRYITEAERQLFLARLDELFPGRRDARLFVEGLSETGCRFEELAAVRREAVDVKAGLIDIGPVMERDGTIREHPKGARSHHDPGYRAVPVGDEYLTRLKPIVMATPKGGLIYTASKGGPILYPTWRARVWNSALRVPVYENGKRVGWEPLIDEPLPTPHDWRHNMGTDLADNGVELHDRMKLMEHKDVRSGMRYTSSKDSRYDRAREALRRAREAGR